MSRSPGALQSRACSVVIQCLYCTMVIHELVRFHGQRNLCKRENCLRLCPTRGIDDSVTAFVCADCHEEIAVDPSRKARVINKLKRRKRNLEEVVLRLLLPSRVLPRVMSFVGDTALGALNASLEWAVHLEFWGHEYVSTSKWGQHKHIHSVG